MEILLKFFYENKETIFIIILCIFLGIVIISNVPAILHTPLMSGANAISGVIIIGAIILVGHTENTLTIILGLLGIMFATLNVVGGFVVTDRMLEMFRKKKVK